MIFENQLLCMIRKMDPKGRLKVSGVVSKGFHLLAKLKHDGSSLIFKTFCRSFTFFFWLNRFFSKCKYLLVLLLVSSGLRLASTQRRRPRCEPERTENSAVVHQVCLFRKVKALYSPSVRSSRGWGRSCTKERNNLQAAPSATPNTPRQRTTQNKQTNKHSEFSTQKHNWMRVIVHVLLAQLTCVSSSVTSRFSLFRCLLTKVMRD